MPLRGVKRCLNASSAPDRGDSGSLSLGACLCRDQVQRRVRRLPTGAVSVGGSPAITAILWVPGDDHFPTELAKIVILIVRPAEAPLRKHAAEQPLDRAGICLLTDRADLQAKQVVEQVDRTEMRKPGEALV